MSGLIARGTAVATVVLAVLAVLAVYVMSRPDLVRGGTEVTAEFEDAYPLLEGMHVRVDGAVAGTVKEIELGDDGKAHVAMQLFEGTEPPRRDAIATIRQEDITGDSYVSLSPGKSSEPLGEHAITSDRTMSAPRFDDLLNAFQEPVRRGLELIFVELGRTLEGRGEDLNRAALELRPGIEAATRAVGEAGSQNEVLRRLIADAERVTSQAADRSADVGRLVDSLATTLQTTSEHLPALDRGLEAGPETLERTRSTLARLTAATEAAGPLAVGLNDVAPDLARSAVLLGPFVDDAEVVLDDVEPTLDLVTRLLRASLPTLRANPKRVFTAPFDLTAGFGAVLDTLIGDPALVRSLFDATCYGGDVCDPRDDVGLGAIAVEAAAGLPGYQNIPDAEDRFFVRAAAVPSCENFGAPIEPGCFTALPNAVKNLVCSVPGVPAVICGGGLPLAAGKGEGRANRGAAGPGPDAYAGPDGKLGESLDRTLDDLGLGKTLDELGLDGAGKALDGLGLGGQGGKRPGGKNPAGGNPLNDLLDLLFKP